MARQYHLTLFAVVDGEGNITEWDVCDPHATPSQAGVEIFNEDTEKWESSRDTDGSGDKAAHWEKVEAVVYGWIEQENARLGLPSKS